MVIMSVLEVTQRAMIQESLLYSHHNPTQVIKPLLQTECPGGRAVSAPDFRSRGQGFRSAGGRIQLVTVWCFIAQGLSLPLFHHLDMT